MVVVVAVVVVVVVVVRGGAVPVEGVGRVAMWVAAVVVGAAAVEGEARGGTSTL